MLNFIRHHYLQTWDGFETYTFTFHVGKYITKKLENVYIQKNVIMNLNIMPKLYITNIFFYLNKRSNHKNDDPQ